MSYATAEHDRMIAAMLIPCYVVAVDLAASPPACRVSTGNWTSTWVRWHSLAAGKARHWRAPSLGEQGVLLNPSGQAGMGTFVPGLYGDAGAAANHADDMGAVGQGHFDQDIAGVRGKVEASRLLKAVFAEAHV